MDDGFGFANIPPPEQLAPEQYATRVAAVFLGITEDLIEFVDDEGTFFGCQVWYVRQIIDKPPLNRRGWRLVLTPIPVLTPTRTNDNTIIETPADAVYFALGALTINGLAHHYHPPADELPLDADAPARLMLGDQGPISAA